MPEAPPRSRHPPSLPPTAKTPVAGSMPPPGAGSSHLPPASSRRAALVFTCLSLWSLPPNRLRQWQGTSSGRPSGSIALSDRAIGLPALASRAAGRGRASDRVTGRPGASSRSIWATCPGAWATRKGACPCRSARARATPAAAAPARQRASKRRAGWLSRVWAVPRGSVRRWTQPTPTHTHTRTLLPACMYNKYVLPHLPTPTHETRV